MTLRTGRPRLAALLVLGLLLSWLGLPPVAVPPAFAAFTGCGSDPVVSLSNGAQLDLSAAISDDLADVQQVVYVIHAPAGIQEVAVVNTDGLMGLKERIQLDADNVDQMYNTDTTVYTSQGRVAVTATATLLSALDLTVGSRSVTGLSQQDLSLGFTSSL